MASMFTRRLVPAVLLTGAMTATLIAALQTAAHADVLDVSCIPPSSTTTTYEPPLTTTAQQVTVSSNTEFGPCVSATVAGLTAGRRTAVSVRTMSCADLLTSSTVQYDVTWIIDGVEGASSTLLVNTVTTIVGGVAQQTQTGTVVDGLFEGDSVLRTSQAPATQIALCTAGLGQVSSFYTVGTLTITSIT